MLQPHFGFVDRLFGGNDERSSDTLPSSRERQRINRNGLSAASLRSSASGMYYEALAGDEMTLLDFNFSREVDRPPFIFYSPQSSTDMGAGALLLAYPIAARPGSTDTPYVMECNGSVSVSSPEYVAGVHFFFARFNFAAETNPVLGTANRYRPYGVKFLAPDSVSYAPHYESDRCVIQAGMSMRRVLYGPMQDGTDNTTATSFAFGVCVVYHPEFTTAGSLTDYSDSPQLIVSGQLNCGPYSATTPVFDPVR